MESARGGAAFRRHDMEWKDQLAVSVMLRGDDKKERPLLAALVVLGL